MPDTHDERGGNVADRVGRIADQIGGALDELRGLHGANRAKRGIAGAVANLRDIADEVRRQLASATAPKPLPRITDDITAAEAEASATLDLTIDEVRALNGQPLTTEEWNRLAASIDHLSGPDAWDDDQLEPALIPVTHYVPRLMAGYMAASTRAEKAEAEVARLNGHLAAIAVAHKDGVAATRKLDRIRQAELDQAQTRLFRIVGVVEYAYSLNTFVELEPDETAPTVENVRADVRAILGEGAAAAPGPEPRPAKSSMLMGVFLRVSGLTSAEAGRLLGVSANAVNAWSVGARMNAAHFARLDELNGRAQRVESTTFYHRRASIMTPRDGQPSIYQQWLAEAQTPPIDPPGEPAYFESAPTNHPTELEQP